MDINLESKKTNFLISESIIISVITVFSLTINSLLLPIVEDTFLRYLLLVIISTALYHFLNAPLKEQIQQKDQSLKNMIDETLHELNTPIATIQANIVMLKRSITDEKGIKRLQRIENASSNLKKLYESIEYNIKEEIEYIETTTFDIKDIIQECIEKTDDIQNNITIENQVPSLYINTDKNGFERVIDNLLSNAIKYNKPNGYVKVYLNSKILVVEDSGIGIDIKNLFIVFEKAYQENPTTEGFGIGLSIVKSFCDTHNVKLKIDTKKDIGTKISLDLKKLTLT